MCLKSCQTRTRMFAQEPEYRSFLILCDASVCVQDRWVVVQRLVGEYQLFNPHTDEPSPRQSHLPFVRLCLFWMKNSLFSPLIPILFVSSLHCESWFPGLAYNYVVCAEGRFWCGWHAGYTCAHHGSQTCMGAPSWVRPPRTFMKKPGNFRFSKV